MVKGRKQKEQKVFTTMEWNKDNRRGGARKCHGQYIAVSERWNPSKEMSECLEMPEEVKSGNYYSCKVFLLSRNQKETVRNNTFRKRYCPSRHNKRTA